MTLEDTIRQAVDAGIRDALATLLPVLRQPSTKLAYTLKEACEVTGATEHHIRYAIKRGELHATQAGEKGRYIIPADCLVAWVHGTKQPFPQDRRAKTGS